MDMDYLAINVGPQDSLQLVYNYNFAFGFMAAISPPWMGYKAINRTDPGQGLHIEGTCLGATIIWLVVWTIFIFNTPKWNIITGWCFGTCLIFPSVGNDWEWLGMSSSQFFRTLIFFRGAETTNHQPVINPSDFCWIWGISPSRCVWLQGICQCQHRTAPRAANLDWQFIADLPMKNGAFP